MDKHKHIDLVLDSKISFLTHINAAISTRLLKFLSKYSILLGSLELSL